MAKAWRSRERRRENRFKGSQARKTLPFRASRCSCLGGFTSILTGTFDREPTGVEEVQSNSGESRKTHFRDGRASNTVASGGVLNSLLIRSFATQMAASHQGHIWPVEHSSSHPHSHFATARHHSSEQYAVSEIAALRRKRY